MLLMVARENRDLYHDKQIISTGESIANIDTTINKLTPLQKDKLAQMTEMKENGELKKRLEKEERMVRHTIGNYGDLYEERTNHYTNDLVPYLFFGIWDVLQFMFLGMAFFKLGILTGKAKSSLYLWMFLIGLTVGLLLAYVRINVNLHYGFNSFEYSKNTVISYYNLDRSFRALGIF